MKTLSLLAIAAGLVACGGKSATTATTPPPAPAGKPGDVWAPVLQQGAKWTLIGWAEEGEEPPTLEAEVMSVTTRGEAQLVAIKWTHHWREGAQEVWHGGVPGLIAVSTTGVWLLDASLEPDEIDAALTGAGGPAPYPNPPAKIETESNPEGRYLYLQQKGDETIACYGEGPGPNAPDCEDTCFGDMCVSSKAGIVSASGVWTPNYTPFHQPGYGD